MSASPTMSSVPYFQQQRLIVCWPGDTQISLSFGGEIVYVPGIGEAYCATDKQPHRFQSAQDEKGQPIPGTVEIYDTSWFDQVNMVEKQTFSANGFARHVFGKDLTGRSGAGKEYCLKGLRIAGSPEQARQALLDGRSAWERQTVESAYAILYRRQAQLDQAKKDNQMAPPEPPSVRWALAMVRAAKARGYKRDEATRDEIADALSGFGGGEPDVSIVKDKSRAIPEPQAISDDEKLKLIADDLTESALEAGIKLTPAERDGILKGDKRVTKDLQLRITAALAK